SSGVWALSAGGSLTGRLSMAAFMLGWAGISVHCQVLSFLGGSGLSVGTYLTGKLLHGGLSAVFTALLVRGLHLGAPAGAYLVQQVEGLAALDFHTALRFSVVAAWTCWLLFFLIAALSHGTRRRNKRLQ
ncbi:MAG: sporulation protein, partial [Pseudoflavonifractor sp.]